MDLNAICKPPVVRPVPDSGQLLLSRLARPIYNRAVDALEAEQIIVRVVVGALLISFVYCAMPTSVLQRNSLVYAGIYALFDGVMAAWIVLRPRPSNMRRIAGIFGDVAVATAFSCLAPKTFLYLFTSTVLFIGIGNGFRYSAHHLKMTIALGTAALIGLHLKEPFWGEPIWSWTSAFILLLLLSAYVLKFIRERDASEALLGQRTAELERQTVALKSAQTDLQQALRAREHLLSKVSHELRTPLNNLLQLVQGAKTSPTGLDTSALQAVWVCAELVQDQVSNLLQLADVLREEKEEVYEVFDIAILLKGMVHAVCLEGRKRSIVVAFVMEEDSDTVVRGPAQAIRQIVWNLLTNALKFTNAGSVTVRLCRPRDQLLTGNAMRISVADTGIGISKDHVEKIWEPFYQVETAVGGSLGGTGLGLAIASERAKKIAGRLSVESTPNVGSLFSLDFAVKEVSHEERRRLKEPAEKMLATDPPLSILVAEDDDCSREAVEETLRNAGHRVISCADGLEALAALIDDSYVDVAIVDCHLPTMEGPQIVEQYGKVMSAQGITKRPQFVMWTAGVTAKCRDEALRAGFDHVFTKDSGWLRELVVVLAGAAKRRDIATRDRNSSSGLSSGNGEMGAREPVRTRALWDRRDVISTDLFAKYLSSVEKTASLVEKMLEERRLDAVRDALHRIKGQAAQFGAPFREIISTTQRAALDGDLGRTSVAWKVARGEIAAFLAKQKATGVQHSPE